MHSTNESTLWCANQRVPIPYNYSDLSDLKCEGKMLSYILICNFLISRLFHISSQYYLCWKSCSLKLYWGGSLGFHFTVSKKLRLGEECCGLSPRTLLHACPQLQHHVQQHQQLVQHCEQHPVVLVPFLPPQSMLISLSKSLIISEVSWVLVSPSSCKARANNGVETGLGRSWPSGWLE